MKTLATLLILLLAPFPAAAQFGGVIWCTNCSTFETQLLQYALDVQQLAKDVEIATSASNILLNAIQNTTGRQSTAFRDLSGDLRQLSSLAQEASLLDGFAGQMLTDMHSGFSDTALGNWRGQFAQEAAACSNGMNAAGQVMGLQPAQLLSDAQGLASLVQEILGSDGRHQSLQTLGSVTSSTGQLVQKLQGTLATAHQGQMGCQVAQAHRQAMLDAINTDQLSAAVRTNCVALSAVGGAAAECGN